MWAILPVGAVGIVFVDFVAMLRAGRHLGACGILSWETLHALSTPLLSQSHSQDLQHPPHFALDACTSIKFRCIQNTASDSGSDTVLNATPVDALPTGPVDLAVQIVDGIHAVSGLPWWATIPLTAFAIRTVMLPLTVQQIRSSGSTVGLMKEAAKISKAVNQKEQGNPVEDGKDTPDKMDIKEVVKIFIQMRRATNAPHPFWIAGSPMIQIPVFISSVMAIRRMSVEGWEGFRTGGTLWFQDLTLPAADFANLFAPMGSVGAVVPVCVTLAYFASIESIFKGGRISTKNMDSVGAWLTRLLRTGLEWMSVPVLIISFQLPHGTLLYWLTNSLYSLGTNLAFGNPSVRQALRLTHTRTPGVATEELIPKEVLPRFIEAAQFRMDKKFNQSLEIINDIIQGHPNIAPAHYARGQVLFELKKYGEAAGSYMEAAKLFPFPNQEGEAWYYAGLSHGRDGNFSASEEALLKAHKLNDQDVRYLLTLYGLYKEMDRHEEGMDALKRAAQLDPKCQEYMEKQMKELEAKKNR